MQKVPGTLNQHSTRSTLNLHEPKNRFDPTQLEAQSVHIVLSTMSAPKSLAIIIGAGPTSGAGVARVLAREGNMAVALLARNQTNLEALRDELRKSVKGGVFHSFPSDTSPSSLQKTFKAIAAHPELKELKLRLAIYHVKHSLKEPFMQTTPEAYGESLQTYATGAFAFGQESVRMMYAQNGGETLLADTNGEKKGTIIYTGTLGALRTNEGFAAYGSGRAGARSVAQAIAKEHSRTGVHCVHAIANGGIENDSDSEATRTGKKMSAERVGETYLWLASQKAALWTHELDLRPAQERF